MHDQAPRFGALFSCPRRANKPFRTLASVKAQLFAGPRGFLLRLLGCAFLSAITASMAAAQTAEADSLRGQFKLPVPPQVRVPAAVSRPSPAMGASSPIAFGAAWRDAFVGAGYQSRTRYLQNYDGSIAAGIGLGDPWRLVGLELTAISFSTFRSGFFSRIGIDTKLHRVLPHGFAVAAGWESAIQIGLTDAGNSKYAVLSKWWDIRDDPRDLFSELLVSVGVGNDRFLPEDDFYLGTPGVNGFGSVALRVAQPISVIADWYGQDLALAASVAPLARYRLVITPALVDVTGSAGDGARFVASASYSFRF